MPHSHPLQPEPPGKIVLLFIIYYALLYLIVLLFVAVVGIPETRPDPQTYRNRLM